MRTLVELWPWFRKYRWTYALGAVALVAAVVLRLWIPTRLGQAIDQVRDALSSPDTADGAGSLAARAAVAIVGAALLGAITRTTSRLTILGACRLVTHDMRQAIYARRFGSEPVVEIIHAGLECGVLGERLPGMEMISFGPTIENPHSPDERLHLPSVDKVYVYLRDILASMAAALRTMIETKTGRKPV